MSLGNWTSREISQGKLPVLGGGQRRIYRCGVRMSMGVPVHCLVTHATPALYPVSVRRFRRPVMGFLQIRPRGRHPCLDGRFRSLRPVEDFHLLNWQHAWRTKKNAADIRCQRRSIIPLGGANTRRKSPKIRRFRMRAAQNPAHLTRQRPNLPQPSPRTWPNW